LGKSTLSNLVNQPMLRRMTKADETEPLIVSNITARVVNILASKCLSTLHAIKGCEATYPQPQRPRPDCAWSRFNTGVPRAPIR
jgi:hypothetical protein